MKLLGIQKVIQIQVTEKTSLIRVVDNNIKKEFMKLKFVAMLLIICNSYAFSQNKAVKAKTIVCGSINTEGDHSKESILLYKYPDYSYWGKIERLYCKLDANGRFRFEINEDSLIYCQIKYKNSKGVVKLLTDFLVDKGDSINLSVLNKTINRNFVPDDSIVFTGTRANANTIAAYLFKDYFRVFIDLNQIPKNIGTTKDLDLFLSTFSNIIIDRIKKKEELIKSITDANPDYKKFIHYQYGNYGVHWFDMIGFIYPKCTSDEQKKMITAYFNKFKQVFLESNPDEVSIKSPTYYQLINSSYKIVQLIENGTRRLEVHYDMLKENFKGRTLERVLLEMFKGAYGTDRLTDIHPAFDSIRVDSKRYLITNRGREIMDGELKFLKGSNFYNTKFVGLDGKMFDTKSLRGKAFLFASWGDGCAACVDFHTRFEKEIWPEVKGRKDFEVLSVFNGRSKERWTKLMDGDLYTSKDYINVSTMPLYSANHPFFQNYNVNYSPFIILVDKRGKILDKIGASLSSNEILALINSVSTDTIGVVNK